MCSSRGTRLVKLEQMRSDPKTKDRPQRTHDMLDDFQLLYDELNDNIDTYVDRKDDIRKPLKMIIEADTEFQAKLRALKDAADVPAEEAREYEFVLTNVLDTVDTSAEDHRKLLADQEDAAKHKKLNSNASAKNGEAGVMGVRRQTAATQQHFLGAEARPNLARLTRP